MEENEYQCAQCKEIFTKLWSDEIAFEEVRNNTWQNPFDEDLEDLVIVCDDCFNEIKEVFGIEKES